MRPFIHFLLAFASLFLAVHANYWMGDISHQGVAPYASSGYTVFRNVKDYGAVGSSTRQVLRLVESTNKKNQAMESPMIQLLSTVPSRLGTAAAARDVYVISSAVLDIGGLYLSIDLS